jgi:hypothetical protein
MPGHRWRYVARGWLEGAVSHRQPQLGARHSGRQRGNLWASVFGMSTEVLPACFSAERLSARLPRPDSWHPYPAIRHRAAWDTVHPATRDHVLG